MDPLPPAEPTPATKSDVREILEALRPERAVMLQAITEFRAVVVDLQRREFKGTRDSRPSWWWLATVIVAVAMISAGTAWTTVKGLEDRVSRAIEPFGEKVTKLDESVQHLTETVNNLRETVNNLRPEVAALQGELKATRDVMTQARDRR
ncbi:hypothetical protein HYW17_04290 [Candidatus Uhrbacteria bacterium]|nr:hypothetical protein [Candidatus Uhrbacteria bacterium]